MMKGEFREYSWEDIERLIFADAGLTTEQARRSEGQIWYLGGFKTPEHSKDFCVRVQVYEKPYDERLREHMGEKP